MLVKGDRVGVEILPAEERVTDSGIIISESVEEKNKQEHAQAWKCRLTHIGDGVEDACMYRQQDFADYEQDGIYLVELVEFDDNQIGETIIMESERLIAKVV